MHRMKKNLACRLFLILLSLSIMLSLPIAYAHPPAQEGVVRGGEDVGWSIDENCHTNGSTITYNFDTTDPNIIEAYRSYVSFGASMWSEVVTITKKTDGTAKGIISTSNSASSNLGTDDIARFAGTYDSNGHLTRWTIKLNLKYKSKFNSRIMAHEFGHVIGLCDVRESKNSGKIMYGSYDSWTVNLLTDSDKWGARVITGNHSSHSFAYGFYRTDANSANWHKYYCTACGGIKSTGKCTYGTNNRCKVCGIPKGQQTSGIKINPAE